MEPSACSKTEATDSRAPQSTFTRTSAAAHGGGRRSDAGRRSTVRHHASSGLVRRSRRFTPLGAIHLLCSWGDDTKVRKLSRSRSLRRWSRAQQFELKHITHRCAVLYGIPASRATFVRAARDSRCAICGMFASLLLPGLRDGLHGRLSLLAGMAVFWAHRASKGSYASEWKALNRGSTLLFAVKKLQNCPD
jgi:hypothetical protein